MFHKIKLIFKAYVKTNNAKKDSEKKHVKNIKIFLQKKKNKKRKSARKGCQSFTEEEKGN